MVDVPTSFGSSGGPMRAQTTTIARCIRYAAIILGAVLVIAGCSSNLTQIVLVVDTTFVVPDQLDAVVVSVSGPSGVSHDAHGTITGVGSLPFTLGLADGTTGTGPVTVTVTGNLQGSPVVQRVAQLSFVVGETLTYEIVLSPNCVNVACSSGDTCDNGSCRSVVVDPSELVPWTGSTPQHITGSDASTDVPAIDAPVTSDATAAPDGPATQDVVVDNPPPADVLMQCTPSAVTDFCNEVPPLAADPVIDGVLECGVTLTPLTPVAWTGMVAIPAGYSAQYAIGWRPTGLYVFFSVTTPQYTPDQTVTQIYCGDALEFDVDTDGMFAVAGRYDNPGTIHLFAASPSSPTKPALAGRLDASWAGRSPRRGGARARSRCPRPPATRSRAS